MTNTVLLAGGETLVNVHPEEVCRGESCPIHKLSDHIMRAFPQHFRMDNGLMERICPHGIGHPDPDALPYFRKQGMNMSIHGCDGCCSGTGPPVPAKHKEPASFPFDRL